MIENKPYPADVIENAEGQPLLWFHNQALNRMEAFGRMQGAYLIEPFPTMEGKTLYSLWAEAFALNIVMESKTGEEGSAFHKIGIFKQLDSAIKVAELLENG